MAEFVVYSKHNCPYCTAAKMKLTELGHTFIEKRVDDDEAIFDELKALAPDARTVPQIFVKSYRIGGYDQLDSLIRSGMLDMTIDMAS